MTVSMVKRCHQTETHPIELEEIWSIIKSGEHDLKKRITRIRNKYESERDITGDPVKAKKAVADLKLDLPGFMASGTFSTRANNALVQYSGLLCADLDTLGTRLPEIREMFKTMPYVRAIALSPSGDGLKVFFNVVNDPARHEDSFRAIRDNVRDLGIEIDEKCKDLARICFFTYDPDLWLNAVTGEVFPPADPLPRGNSDGQTRNQDCPPDMTTREQVAFRLLGELRPAPEKGGYFVVCPGVNFHTHKSGEKHTILYLDGAPTLNCQHNSCSHVVDAFNKVLRSEIGKAESAPPPVKDPFGKNGEAPSTDEKSWNEILTSGTVTSTQLHGLSITPRKRLMGSWFCEADLGFFFGPRGAGKTWFTLGFVQAVTTAGTFGDWEAPEAVKVLYVDGEMPPDSMQQRCEGLKAINDNFSILNHSILFDRTDKTVNITNPLIQQGLTAFCLDNAMKVLVLDNLSTLGVGMKENDADSWELVNNWLLTLRKRGVAVVIIHHSGRSGHMRGTSRREDNVFWIINIDDIRKDSEEIGAAFTTRFTKQSRNTPDEIPDYEWHFTPDKITGLITVSHKTAQSLTVFRSVIESGVSKPGEIAKVMRVEDYQVSRMAHKAIGQGWLERVNRGEYAIIAGK